ISSRGYHTAFSLVQARGWVKSIRDWLFLRSCGIRRVVGSPLRREDRLCLPGPDGRLYQSEAFRLVQRIGATSHVDLLDDRWWDLRLTPDELSQANALLEPFHFPFIATSLGTKVEVNHWTENNWRALLQHAHARWPDLGLVLIGAKDEFASCERCAQGW